MRFRHLLALAPLLALAACEPAGQDVKLPSGKQIRILGIVRTHFSNRDPVLTLRYQTAIPLDDKPALAAEVDEIWERFRLDVERAGFTSAFIQANDRPRGFIVTYSSHVMFGFSKSSSGQWSGWGEAKD